MIETGGRYALIVAVADYRDEKLRKLRAPIADAARLGAVLEDSHIGGFDVEIATDDNEGELKRRIARFVSDRRPEDLLLIHFSCHGVKDENGELYLAARDTEVGDMLSATGIAASWLSEQIGRTRSKRVVVMLDCCFGGSFPFGMRARAGDDVNVQQHLQGRGRAVITASSAMEYAYEGDRLSGRAQPSIFTNAVVEGLESGKADRDGDRLISVDDLYDYVYERVKDTTPSQSPNKMSTLEGPLYLARSVYEPPIEPADHDPQMVAAIESPYAGVRLGAVWELAPLLSSRDRSVVLAARKTLQQMLDDDSLKVSQAARAALHEHDERSKWPGTTGHQTTAAPPPLHAAAKTLQPQKDAAAGEQAKRQAIAEGRQAHVPASEQHATARQTTTPAAINARQDKRARNGRPPVKWLVVGTVGAVGAVGAVIAAVIVVVALVSAANKGTGVQIGKINHSLSSDCIVVARNATLHKTPDPFEESGPSVPVGSRYHPIAETQVSYVASKTTWYEIKLKGNEGGLRRTEWKLKRPGAREVDRVRVRLRRTGLSRRVSAAGVRECCRLRARPSPPASPTVRCPRIPSHRWGRSNRPRSPRCPSRPRRISEPDPEPDSAPDPEPDWPPPEAPPSEELPEALPEEPLVSEPPVEPLPAAEPTGPPDAAPNSPL